MDQEIFLIQFTIWAQVSLKGEHVKECRRALFNGKTTLNEIQEWLTSQGYNLKYTDVTLSMPEVTDAKD